MAFLYRLPIDHASPLSCRSYSLTIRGRLDLVGSSALDCYPRFDIPLELCPIDVTYEEATPALRALVYRLNQAMPGLSPILDALGALSSVAATVTRKHGDPTF